MSRLILTFPNITQLFPTYLNFSQLISTFHDLSQLFHLLILATFLKNPNNTDYPGTQSRDKSRKLRNVEISHLSPSSWIHPNLSQLVSVTIPTSSTRSWFHIDGRDKNAPRSRSWSRLVPIFVRILTPSRYLAHCWLILAAHPTRHMTVF